MPKGIKLGGRVAGTPNKATKQARDKFQWLLDSYTDEEMRKDFKAMQPKERLFFISDIAEFIVPKLSRQELTGKDGKDLQPTVMFMSAEKLTDDQLDKFVKSVVEPNEDN